MEYRTFGLTSNPLSWTLGGMEHQEQGATGGLNAAVAAEIRAILARRGWKGSTLAARLDVSEMWVSRRLRGAKAIDVDDLERIADALGMKPVNLLGLAEQSASQENYRKLSVAEQPPIAHPPANRRPADTRPTGRPQVVGGPPSSRRPNFVVREHVAA